jgi:hypothetical protein
MTATTADTTFTEKRDTVLFPTYENKVPVAADAVIHKGAMVGMLDGYAVVLAAFPQARPLGRAEGDPDGQDEGPTIDNTGGASGDLFVKVERGIFLLKNSAGVEALAASETGDPCYFVDNQTVSRHDAKGQRPLMGTFLGLDAETGGCWVQVGVGPQTQIVLTGLAGEDLSAHQYGAVKLSAGGIVKCGDGERAFGILQNAPANADVAKVCVFGPSLAKAGAGFTTDLAVASDGNGLIVDAVASTLAANAALTVGANIAAFTDPPSAAEMALLRTFVNALKTDITAIAANTSIVGDQALGVARATTAGAATGLVFVAPAGLI